MARSVVCGSFPCLIAAHFCKPWKPVVSFIGLAKTSQTAGTLYVINPQIYIEKMLKFYIQNAENIS
jgi:hypothetical protein